MMNKIEHDHDRLIGFLYEMTYTNLGPLRMVVDAE